MGFRGPTRHRTTAYHPQSNGLVERFHRCHKEAMRTLPHPTNWADALPIILLPFRATEKEDINHTPAELVYGEDLRLPSQFAAEQNGGHPLSFLPALQQAMTSFKPVPLRPFPSNPTHFPADLRAAETVLLRTGPLQPPYTGPYWEFARVNKYITLDIKRRPYITLWDRVKAAHLSHTQQPRQRVPHPPILDPSPPPASRDARLQPHRTSNHHLRVGAPSLPPQPWKVISSRVAPAAVSADMPGVPRRPSSTPSAPSASSISIHLPTCYPPPPIPHPPSIPVLTDLSE